MTLHGTKTDIVGLSARDKRGASEAEASANRHRFGRTAGGGRKDAAAPAATSTAS
jgi:hypothetical protein